MKDEPMTAELADKIWTILVDGAGAAERDRYDFVFHQTHKFCTEYRFCGELGFGGKFWRNQGRHYVTCYAEDENEIREALMQAVNARLALMVEG